MSDTSGVIQDIYGAVAIDQQWEAIGARLAFHLGARACALTSFDVRSQHGRIEFSANIAPQFVANYADLAATDPWYRHDRRLHVSAVDEDLSPHQEPVSLARHQFLREWMTPLRFSQRLSVLIEASDHCLKTLMVFRGSEQKEFDDAAQRRLEALSPHLARALMLRRRLLSMQERCDALLEAFDHLAIGFVLIGKDEGPIVWNDTAGKHLDQVCEDGAGRLDRQDGANRHRPWLDKAVGGAARQSLCRSQPTELILKRPTATPVKLTLHPLRDHAVSPGHPSPWAAMYLRDLACKTRIDRERLCSLFGLTRVQANLAALLVEGATLDRAAAELRISRHTARDYLKIIFTKTGTNRQVDLVRLVLSEPDAVVAA